MGVPVWLAVNGGWGPCRWGEVGQRTHSCPGPPPRRGGGHIAAHARSGLREAGNGGARGGGASTAPPGGPAVFLAPRGFFPPGLGRSKPFPPDKPPRPTEGPGPRFCP